MSPKARPPASRPPPPTKAKQRFVRFAKTIARALGVPLPRRALAAVQVVGPTRRPQVATLCACGLSAEEGRLAAARARAGHSSFWPAAALVVLASRANAHLAEEAAHFLRHALAPFRCSTSLQDAFYQHTVEEALAFFASKLICPTRRPLPLAATLTRRHAHRFGAAVAASARAHLTQASGGRSAGALFSSDPSVSHAVSHLLGYRLGQALFVASDAGACDKAKLAALFTRQISGQHQALLLYWQLTLALRHYLPKAPRAQRRRPAPICQPSPLPSAKEFA